MKSRNQALGMSLTLCLLLALLAGRGQPQGWHYNAGGRLLGVKSRGNNIWVVGAQGLILHSTDRGDTWNIRESGTPAIVDLYSVSFPDDLHGWAVGDYGYPIYVLRTTDGGVNWQIQTTINNAWGRGVSFVDSLHGWICGPIDTVLKTTDGGSTWSKQPMNRGNHGTSICFTDTLRGYMPIDNGNGTIMKTTDGGQTWVLKANGGEYVDMLDGLRGWAAGGEITITSDGWETSTIQYAPPSAINGISIGSATSVWAAGYRRTIVTTSNGGSSWVVDTSLASVITNYYGVDGHLQLTNTTVVGDGGAIIRSTNAGATWRVIRNVDIGNTSLINAAFYDSNQGWAVGTYGVITHTTNGGTVWSKQTSGTSSFLWGVDFPNPNIGWVCTDGAEILTTANAGNTWTPQTSQTTQPLNFIEFLPNDTLYGWAVGGWYYKKEAPGPLKDGVKGESYPRNQVQGQNDTQRPWGTWQNEDLKWPWRPEETLFQTPFRVITRTTNGGALWIAQNDTNQVPLYGVSFASRAEGWACGDPQGGMGVIIHTTDSGATWTGQTSNVNQSLHWIQFKDPQTGWCVGSGGAALWTTNGGSAWNQGNTGTTAALWSCAFYDNLNGFACGGNGLLIKTTDGGRNWTPDTSQVYANLYAVNALDSLHAWTVGSYGMVLGWRLAGTSGVEQRGRGAEELRVKNGIKAWPNPFVSYARVPGHEKERFALYDVSGRRVGTYSGERIGADVGSGVYFLMAEGKEVGPTRIVKIK